MSLIAKPKVLIVGAGIGGMALGILLHKAKIPFEIYERATVVKPLGTAMGFNATTAVMFKQCGFYDEFLAVAKPMSGVQVGNIHRTIDYKIDFSEQEELFGANGFIVPRPDICDLLARHVPKEHMHMGKKVIASEQSKDGVRLSFADGTTAEGHILVGADGAYSTIRQHLYNQLKKEDRLPASDAEPLPFSSICLVGQTKPLDPKDFPNVSLEESQIQTILGKGTPYSWSTFTTKRRTIAWAIGQVYNEERSTADEKNEEWGPGAADAMCEISRDFPVISGGEKVVTIGDLIDWTPKELITKVMLEEKVFETWYDGRVVLLGDACHKINPAGGAGASNAIHDAITIANWIYALPPSPTTQDIEKYFAEYTKERLPMAKAAYDSSVTFKNISSKSYLGWIAGFAFKNMPAWMNRKMMAGMMAYRPSVAFLPDAEDNGTVKPWPQHSLEARRIVKERMEAAASQA
ncbi:hypothetical protein BGZ96_010253 [Linnemannia gamsii]|uniref:FAD-binding domain-containing protein n=1 Tax=Linnemannia gamsii TaxID=64522 RepID=A0ABQ7JUV3_9FUNG|nr:hypothetical protein BGZ96_010253 [Linnemannia gamsii]